MIPKICLALISLALAAKGDLYSNGQYFGPGIIIIDAPAPNSTFQVNSTMPIAIDVSLDGEGLRIKRATYSQPTNLLYFLFALSGKITKQETGKRPVLLPVKLEEN